MYFRTRHRLTQRLETERTADRLAGESAGNQVGQSDLDSADAGNNEARETQGSPRPGFQPNRKPGFNSRIRPHARIPSETPEINPALVEADVPVLPVASIPALVEADVPVLPVASIPASTSLEETSTVDLDDPTPEESEPETVDQSIIQSDLEPIINQSSLPAQPPVFIPIDVVVETNQQVESQPPLLEETDQPSLLQETNQPNPTQELNQLFLPQAVDKPNLLEAVNDPILPQELDEQAVELSTNEGEEEVYYYYYYDGKHSFQILC